MRSTWDTCSDGRGRRNLIKHRRRVMRSQRQVGSWHVKNQNKVGHPQRATRSLANGFPLAYAGPGIGVFLGLDGQVCRWISQHTPDDCAECARVFTEFLLCAYGCQARTRAELFDSLSMVCCLVSRRQMHTDRMRDGSW